MVAFGELGALASNLFGAGSTPSDPVSELKPLQGTSDEMHGRLGNSAWDAPRCVTEFDVNARLSFTGVKAHEYTDAPSVMREKVKLLATLIRKSKRCIVYTGAGISTAAGIDDYATKAKDLSVTAKDRPKLKDWKLARPTTTHRVLTALYEAGHLKHWIQQNHDSLPQKAGYPQHALNEIHGSLHDPANPVVPYEGTLRADLFQWLDEWEHANDLCIAMGTSLSGFNADRVPATAAQCYDAGSSLGLVIINLQQTPYDGQSSLRIFGRVDDVMLLLSSELGIASTVRPAGHVYQPDVAAGSMIDEDVFQIPFDSEGNPSSSLRVTWDLRAGQCVRLTDGPYAGDVGVIMGKNADGHYRIRFEDTWNRTLKMRMRPFSLWLGSWWVAEATHGFGIVPGGRIPFTNVERPQWAVEALRRQEAEACGGAIGGATAPASGAIGGTTAPAKGAIVARQGCTADGSIPPPPPLPPPRAARV